VTPTVDHSLSLPQLQFATTMPLIVPLTDNDYLQELYEAEEQFGKTGRQVTISDVFYHFLLSNVNRLLALIGVNYADTVSEI